jgi:Cu-processing system ATP-binding protein
MISVQGLLKSFGKLEVLKGVEATFPRGRITALVGPNGSGKTTLIKAILGLSRPDGGSIQVRGHRLNGDWRYRVAIGYMPQIPPLPENLSAAELFQMLGDLRGSEVGPDGELIHRFGLADLLQRPLRTLSGGTRQKVNAVMAFTFDPDILILDEPTAGLDPLAARHLKDRIRREREVGKTIIVTSHVLSELQELADCVVFLLEGSVRFSGSASELLAHTGAASLEGAVAELMMAGVGS